MRLSQTPFSLCLFFLPLAFLQGADTLQLPSPIDSVLLYSHQAEVTRHVNGPVPAGTHWIKIPRVSRYADVRSARVNLNGAFRLLEVELHQDSELETQNHPRLRKALANLDQRQAALHSLLAQQEGLQAQKELLRANQKQDYSSISQLEARANFFARQIKALQEKLLALQKEIDQAQEAFQKQQRKVEELRQELQLSNRYWLLKVETPRAGEISLALRYLVGAVSWQSTYRATRMPGVDSLLLQHQALIEQHTGVPWQEVKLALALGAPLQSSELPELPPYFINAPRPAEQRTYRDGIKATSSISYMEEEDMRKSSPPALVESGTFRLYQLPQPVSIGPDNPQVERTLRRYTLPASYRYESHPVQHPAAFLQARITGFERLPLPPGEVKRYNGDTYVGSQHWNPRLTTDTLSLSLGRDGDIHLNRNLQERYTEYKALGQKKEVTVRHEIIVVNHKSHPITLVLREPLPVARTEQVSVERLPGPGEWNQEKGHLIYRLELPPGARKTLRPAYRVTAPREFPLDLP